MSFLHTVRVGFFGPPHDEHPERELLVSECADLVRGYNAIAPTELRIVPEEPPRGNPSRGTVVGVAEGYPLVLKAGVLFCPYLTTHYLQSAIGFVAYLQKQLGCSISSDDGFLTLGEFIPERSFAKIVHETIQTQNAATAETPSAGN